MGQRLSSRGTSLSSSSSSSSCSSCSVPVCLDARSFRPTEKFVSSSSWSGPKGWTASVRLKQVILIWSSSACGASCVLLHCALLTQLCGENCVNLSPRVGWLASRTTVPSRPARRMPRWILAARWIRSSRPSRMRLCVDMRWLAAMGE